MTVALFIDPPTHHFLCDRLFDSATVPFAGENILAPHIAVREHFEARGIAVHTADQLERHGAERNLFVSLGRLEGFPLAARRPDTTLSAFFALECPIVEPTLYRALPRVEAAFRRLFTWTEGAELRRFTGRLIHSRRFWWPQSFDQVEALLWSRTDRRFLTMMNTNKLPRLYDHELYTARLRAVAFFHRFGEIDLYGRAWDRMPQRVGRTRVPYTFRRIHAAVWERWQRVRPHPLYAAAAAASRGPVLSKLGTLAEYRFAICFENMILRGWITEKLFDCLCAGTVPVYWGAPDVAEWVDPACFIDMRAFAGLTELRQFLHALSPAEVARYREAGRDYLGSAQFDRFRRRAWVDLFRAIVREDAEVDA